MSRRPLVWGGLGAAGVAGYYLYSAGGDPKVAQKQVKRERIVLFVKLFALTELQTTLLQLQQTSKAIFLAPLRKQRPRQS
jgi:hypothetical protein